MSTPPKVFISYSHDSDTHKAWVLMLATRLRQSGIDATLDQWEVPPGGDLTHFMETHLRQSDHMIMVCTDRYVEKANNGEGGVGYEKMIITAQLMKNITSTKVIPIIRQDGTYNVPTFLETKLFINFSNDSAYDTKFEELARALHQTPLYAKPDLVVGNPYAKTETLTQKPDIGYNPFTEPAPAPQPRHKLAEPQGRITLPHVVRDDVLNMEWCWIPSGEFTMGEREKAHQVHVDGFWMGRYPVTNQRFSRFLKANSYKTEKWWTEAGWKWRRSKDVSEPRYWRDNQWNGDNQPVIGVSWYESLAFGAWASELTGLDITLATEAQWEKAARGTDGRTYPWGNEDPTDKRLNFKNNVGKTTDVGRYRVTGQSPYGCRDMSGNVWEWCLSKWADYPYQNEDGRNEEGGENSRILRGGAWGNGPDNCRAASRNPNGPSGRHSICGFRVCVRRPPSH